ncbi:MAG: D-alanyl-D-alanine carboxypeptidase [Candidatus Yanofskybacteria bacterium]|nr:D-alanyl-D-alanine carboxypeptidase [Candidatus Yanofskybacteria bacterium]
MRLNVILITIVLGGMISGAVFFIFGYPVEVPNANLEAQPLSGSGEGQQAFLLPVSESNYLPIRDFNVPEPEIEARAAALYDIRSGRFLFTKNINKRLPIASITKLMTAVVVLENLNIDQIFTVSAETINVDGNGADFYKGEQLRVADLLKIMLVKSSNDAALTLTVEAQRNGLNLIEKMNEKAQSLGMYNTKFTDPAGLDDNNAFSTAADLVKLVHYAESYELISRTLQEISADVSSVDGRIKHHLLSTNQLLGQIPNIVLGKTGFTDNALGTMALEAEINNGADGIISVILGSAERFGETKKLIEWGKTAYSWE